MAQITGGFIEYSEQVQPGTFGSPQAKAHFDFSVPEGDSYNAIAQTAAREARKHVRIIIGLQKPDVAQPATAETPAPVKDAAPAAGEGKAPVNDKERLAQELIAKTTPPAAKPARKPKAPAAAPETGQAISEGTAGDDPTGEAAPADELDELFGGAAPEAKPITDKELVDAAQARNKTLGNPQKILDLREKYAGPPPKQMRDIPKEKRADFLKELAALT